MSRTHKKEPYNYFRKEKKALRKVHYKSYRHKTNQQLREGVEEVEDIKKTGGWLTH